MAILTNTKLNSERCKLASATAWCSPAPFEELKCKQSVEHHQLNQHSSLF